MRTPRWITSLARLLGTLCLLAGSLLALLGSPAFPSPVSVFAATTLHVTDCGDTGAGTLRGQIGAAGPGDTIVFDQNCTIILATTLTPTVNLTIDGTGHTVVVDGGCTFSGGTCTSGGATVFTVNFGLTLALNSLIIQHGNGTTGCCGGVGGGGIYNVGTMTVTNTIFDSNAATGSNNADGGAIFNAGTLTITGSTFSHNAAAGAGGGIFNTPDFAALTVTNSTFTSNSAPYDGGGIAQPRAGSSTLVVTKSTFSGNSVSTLDGGGLFVNGTFYLTNITVSGNSAGRNGGGIAIGDAASATTELVTNSTISSNSAANGGGISSYLSTLTNTIVASNTGTTAGPDLYGGFVSGGHSLIGDITSSSGITNGSNGDIVNNTPLLGTLSNNGGPNQTIPLASGSPAIGNGDPTVCANTTGPAPVAGKDQRGFARPANRCAIGAFEPQPTTYTVGSTSDTGPADTLANCQNATNTTCRLRDAIGYAGSGLDTIQFNSTGRGTIMLSGGTLILATSVTITGPTSGTGVSVDGGCTSNCGTGGAVGGVTVFIVNSGVTASLSNVTIQNGNNATSPGGGIYNAGTLTVANSTFTKNSAIASPPLGTGGAIYNDSGTLSVTGSIFSGNFSASRGSAITNDNSGTLAVTNSAFTGNSTLNGTINNLSGTLTLTNSTLSGNTASVGGGGINNFSTVTVTNTTISGNTAANGGGIINNGQLTMTNSTLTNNSATTTGGGIDNVGGPATLTNTIVAGNTVGGSGTAPDLKGTFTTGGHNLIGTISGSTGIANGVSGDIVNPTPLLGTLGAYGGTTQTVPLLPGSPAIDAGNDTVCNTTSGIAPVNKLDQRNVIRPQGAHCDIGAFESQGFSLNKTSGDAQSVAINTAFAPLVVTVASAHSEPVDGGVVTFTGPATGAGIVTSPATATIGTGTTGQASITPTANGTAGANYSVTAAVATGTTPTSVTFTLTNATGGVATLTPGANTTPQSTTVGTAFAISLSVTAKDAGGNLVADGTQVTFTAPAQSGASATFPSGGVATTTNGVASIVATANMKAGGPYTVTATSNGKTATFQLTNTAGAAASVTANPGTTPQSTQVNKPFATPLSVTVKDAGGNLVADGTQVTFTAPTSGASATFPNAGVATTTNGIASIVAIANNNAGGPYTVTATSNGKSATFQLTNTAGPPPTPTGLHVTGATYNSLTWSWSEADATAPLIYTTDGSHFYGLAAGTTTFTLYGIAYGSFGCITIAAYNGSGASPYTAYSCSYVVPITPYNPHVTGATKPTGPKATGSVSFGWANYDSLSYIAAYDGTTNHALGVNATSYTASVAPGYFTCITVAAYNVSYTSPYSAWACGLAVPAMPTNVHVTGTGTGSVSFAWTNGDPYSGIALTNDGVHLLNEGINATSYTQTGLAANQYACIEIAAYNSSGASAYTSWVCGQAGP